MSTLRMHAETRLTPEQFIAGLTDFSHSREELFGNSADEFLQVHELGSGHADVTEGSGGIWERLDYDWSDPGHVVLTTTDSNAWGHGSGHTYHLTRLRGGTTEIAYTAVREGKNPRGWLLGGLAGGVRRVAFVKAFRNSVKAIEARSESYVAR
jgi:hypothetical protein